MSKRTRGHCYDFRVACTRRHANGPLNDTMDGLTGSGDDADDDEDDGTLSLSSTD